MTRDPVGKVAAIPQAGTGIEARGPIPPNACPKPHPQAQSRPEPPYQLPACLSYAQSKLGVREHVLAVPGIILGMIILGIVPGIIPGIVPRIGTPANWWGGGGAGAKPS